MLLYIAGLATPFLLCAVWFGVGYSLLRDSGIECMVCDHLHTGINERRPRIYIWIRKAWHRIWWGSRRWHKEATAAHFAKWQR